MSRVKKGTTNVTRYIMAVDSTTGAPVTGATITNFDLQYTRAGDSPATKQDATALAATNSSHADNKMIEVDSTSSPGLYRVDWPDAAFATGTDHVILVVTNSTDSVAPAVEEVELVDNVVGDVVDGNGRVDVGSWLGTAVTISATTSKPEVDANSISDSSTAADNVESNIANLDVSVSSRSSHSDSDAASAVWGAGTRTITGGTVDTTTNVTNAVDINMGQTNPGSPTSDTVGEAMRNSAQSLPTGAAPGDSTGLARVTDLPADIAGSLRLVSTTMQAGSTTSQLIANSSDLPAGATDDIYNTLTVIAIDDSASSKPNIRYVTDFDAGTSTFTLDTPIDFTPEDGVDTFEVWAVSATSAGGAILSELEKVTTGFSRTAPNNLNSYMKAAMHTGATNPSSVGGFAASSDSLEALRGRIDLVTGSGFSTGTDSLSAIRTAIDDLVAPVVVTSGSAGTSGFLADCVSLIRKITDEPGTTPKYTDGDIVEYIHNAMDQVVSTINIDTDHPILARYDIEVVTSKQDYLLPCNVGEVWRVASIDTQTGLPRWEVWPTNEYTFSARGFTIEGNIIRFNSRHAIEQTLQVLYVPLGETSIHTGTAAAGTSDSITLDSTPSGGTLDTRLNAYAAYMVRILSGTGAGQERVVSSYDSATLVAKVRPDWTTTPSTDSVYEVLPQYSRMIKHVTCLHAALDILSNEAKSSRRQEVERRLQHKMTTLRNTLGKKNNRWGTRGPGVDTWDNDDIWPMLP